MGKKVIITEKPSVAREFAKALNVNGKTMNGYIESDEYIVTWCVGHLVTMSYPEKYDSNLKYWNLKTLPFIPTDFKYEIIDSVKKQFDIVANILNRQDVDTIYVCTDSGREGEYIYRLVDSMAECKKQDKRRVWIDSQTEEAIKEGINSAKKLEEYNSLSDAAYLRAKEDYLIGINFSRLLSIIYGKGLAKILNQDRASISIGRVMTCVLGMIVKREIEIRNFKKVNFYKIQGVFGENEKITADWKAVNTSKYFENPKLYNETGFKLKKDAESLISEIKNSDYGTIKEVSKKTQKENAPLLYNLAEIQNECSKRFKITPEETLNIIQELYEKKLVTYPRTDARVLSTAIAKEIKKNLNGLFKSNIDNEIKKCLNKMIEEKYNTNLLKSKYVDDSKITDHYAIIPTGQGFENYGNLENLKKEIYHLIVRRFLSVFYPPAEYNKINVKIDVGGEEFNANCKICIKQGYLEVLKKYKSNVAKDDLESKIEDSNILKNLKKGNKIKINELLIKEGETTPPTRYTSGSIILAMENAGKLVEDETLREQIKGSGIGTSATRAEIINKLTRIEYIEINPKTQILTPTKKGEEIYNIVLKTMPDMLNPELTASWEKGLSLVAQNKIKAEEFMDKLRNYVSSKVVKLKKTYNSYYYGI